MSPRVSQWRKVRVLRHTWGGFASYHGQVVPQPWAMGEVSQALSLPLATESPFTLRLSSGMLHTCVPLPPGPDTALTRFGQEKPPCHCGCHVTVAASSASSLVPSCSLLQGLQGRGEGSTAWGRARLVVGGAFRSFPPSLPPW